MVASDTFEDYLALICDLKAHLHGIPEVVSVLRNEAIMIACLECNQVVKVTIILLRAALVVANTR